MKKIIQLMLLLLFSASIYSQKKSSDDPVILTIDGQKITKSEFLRIYNKNNNASQANSEKQTVQDYMDMFINYKLKVIEAEHLGFDTVSSFVKEFTGYRDQLAKPYLTDEQTEEKLMKIAYERMKEDVHVRHILIKVYQYCEPKDTLPGYNKAYGIYESLKRGVPWDTLNKKYNEDYYTKSRNGDLGFCTSFQLLYPLESAAYNLKAGEVSKPVRTKLGYHIVQVLERRPSRGEMQASQIMAMFPENARPSAIDSARLKIDSLYKKVQAGENFAELASKYSDDRRSGRYGGDLGWFGVGQMIPEFEEAAFALQKDGDISAPLRTAFGYHIIKRTGKRPISSYESLKDNIRTKFNRDERKNEAKMALVNRVKKEINFKGDPDKAMLLLPVIDSSVFTKSWDFNKAQSLFPQVIFKLGNTDITMKDFAQYVATSRGFYQKPVPLRAFLREMYKDFEMNKILDFEKTRLEAEYPEFRYLVQEYHDGILLFNLMEEKIWTAAAKDTVGLEKYYNDHKNVYKWGERISALVITSPNKDLVNEAYKYANDYYTGKLKSKDILDKVCKDSLKTCLNVTDTLFEKGDNLILDSIGWNFGISQIISKDGKYGFFVKKSLKQPEQKAFSDVKGVCIADYQVELENKYLSDLRKKYAIVINNDVLKSLK